MGCVKRCTDIGKYVNKKSIIWLVFIIIFFTIPFICSISMASDYPDIENVIFVKNHDGDTITVNILGWPDIIGKEIPIRVIGIDAPEIKGVCDNEVLKAVEAKRFVNFELTGASKIDIVEVGRDKYFRIDGDIVYDGKSLRKEMLDRGYAFPYDGGTKINHWCKKH
jgi:endonuclease YncB( thermonuclease family)